MTLLQMPDGGQNDSYALCTHCYVELLLEIETKND